MLEEYICLGGNEIANNARAWGYGTTAGCPVTWYRCEPCDTLHDSTNDWVDAQFRTIEYARNLFVNPSYEATSGTVQVRANFMTGPRATSTASWGSAVSGGSATVSAITGQITPPGITTAVRTTIVTGGTYVDLQNTANTVVPGSVYSFSTWARFSGTGAQAVQFVQWLDAGNAVLTTATGPTITAYTPNVWERYGYANLTAPANAVRARYIIRYVAAVTTGMTLDATGMLVEQSPIVGPYFDGVNLPRIRENLVTNPFPIVSGAEGALVPGWTGLIRQGNFAVNASTAAFYTDNITARPGDLVGASVVLTSTVNTTLTMSLRESTGGVFGSQPFIQSKSVTLVAGVPQLVTLGGTVTGPASNGVRIASATLAAGSIIQVSQAILERDTTVAGPYFDGSGIPPVGYTYGWAGTIGASTSFILDSDFTVGWTGAADTTTSEVRGAGVPGTAASNASVRVISSTEWAGSRTRSIRLIPSPNPADPTNSFTFVGATSAFAAGLLAAGKTYTILATVRLSAPLTGTLYPHTRRIAVTNNGTGTLQWASDIAPNAAGSYDLRLTVTMPADATAGTIRLYNGASFGNGDVWWDKVAVIEGTYLGDYFDGDSAEPSPDDMIRWAGTADASASIWERSIMTAAGQSAEPPFTAGNIQYAPWYDAESPDITSRFFGVFVLSVEGVDDSTRTATTTQGILDGGVVGLVRHSTRAIRVRALLAAEGEDALEYGVAWLNAALAADGCSTHGASCGAVDMNFFGYCPTRDHLGDPTDNAELAARHMHTVTVTSGPLIEQKIKAQNNIHYGYIVEWTMVAGTPWVFSKTKQASLTLLTPVVVQDVPYNLVPYPSAELTNGTSLLATNYSTNPSVEADATLWVAEGTVITPAPTGARSTEIAAQGAASFKVSVTATNTSTNGSLRASQIVTLPAEVAGQRFSINMWGFLGLVSGTAVLGGIRLVAEWRTAANAIIRTDNIGTAAASGGAISGVGLVRPAGVTNVRVYMIGDVTSWSTGAILNLFADALAVTIP